MLKIFIAIALVLSAYAIYTDEVHPYVCVEHTTVEKILSVNGRSQSVQLANGDTAVMGAITLQPGDDFCLRYEQK